MTNQFSCCEYHDRLPEAFEPDAEPDAFVDGHECGLAGAGKPTVCCRNCPEAIYFEKKARNYPRQYAFCH